MYDVAVPANQFRNWRRNAAQALGTLHRIMFHTWGGLGDQICSEPTIRYGAELFKNSELYLASDYPEVFQHIAFKKVFNVKKGEFPVWNDYFVLPTVVPPDDLTWQFFNHCLTNAVDFASLCAYGAQVPIVYKDIRIHPKQPSHDHLGGDPSKYVFVHAGRHWPSKTFPASWWNEVLDAIHTFGKCPVLIGADTDDNRGTVEVDWRECLDLRNKLSINDSIWYLQRAHVLITNDSAPLHMAASGKAHIGFLATCKQEDYIKHWRNNGHYNEWGWRMQNFSKGGIWDAIDMSPCQVKDVTVDKVDEKILETWLPNPIDLALWACQVADLKH